MDKSHKGARVWLTECSRRDFYLYIDEAKITPRQAEIAELRFVKGLLNYQIAMQLNISTKTVEREIRSTYRAINRIVR